MPSILLSLPVLFIKFWYIETPIRLFKLFADINHSVIQILSLPLLIRTFFKPIKNEYRKGLVAFSIGMGIVVKTALIFVDLIIFGFIIFLEFLVFILFIWWPFITVTILFL